jgi:hypothetical protein
MDTASTDEIALGGQNAGQDQKDDSTGTEKKGGGQSGGGAADVSGASTGAAVVETDANESPDSNCVVFKTDANGAVQWTKTLAGSGQDTLSSLTEDQDGGIVVFGTTDSTDGAFEKNTKKGAGFVCKLDNAGALIWLTYPRSAALYDLVSVTEGYVIAGGAYDANQEDLPVFAGLDDSGKTLWQMEASQNEKGAYYSLASTKDGGFVVAGYVVSDKEGWEKDAVLMKYAPAA